jgi:hypothetical protein
MDYTLEANDYVLNCLVFKPLRRFGIDSITFNVISRGNNRHIGYYNPETNILSVPHDIIPTLGKELRDNIGIINSNARALV